MTTMLDPEKAPSPAREIAHKSKGCIAVLIALAVLIGGGYFAYDKASTFLAGFGEIPDYEGAGKKAVTVTIPEGSSLNDIGNILVDQDVVKSVKAWDKAVRLEERAASIQAGLYAMKTQLPADEALRLLLNPGQSRVRVQFTVQEGLRLTDQVAQLVKTTKVSKKNFDAALKKPAALGLPKYAKNRPEGFFFPETYELTGAASAPAVLKQMTAQFNAIAKQIELEDRAKALKVDPYEAVIVASIIEGEVRRPEDRAKVSRVIYNRLAKKQLLQMNSTVDYAAGKSGKVHNTTSDLKNKSPYNTYVHKGLPPGPINAPGRKSLEAAINPADGKWLYFVTVNPDTGETLFAETLDEQHKNEAKLTQWCTANPGRC